MSLRRDRDVAVLERGRSDEPPVLSVSACRTGNNPVGAAGSPVMLAVGLESAYTAAGCAMRVNRGD